MTRLPPWALCVLESVATTITGCKQAGELFSQEGIAFAVTEALDAGLLILGADMVDAHLLRPVGGVDDQRPADIGGVGDLLDQSDQLFPGCGFLQAADVQMRGTAFGVDELVLPMPSTP